MKSLVKYLLFAAILIAGVTLLAVYWTFWKPLPDYSATHNYNQLQDDVQIHWDAYGVPHIYADNLEDLYFSIGHVHAQDRLWQMTLSQMAGEGRLAEFFGEEVVEYDIFQRTIGFWQTAKKMEKSLSDSSRVLLQHYADGVNAYVRNNPDKLPIQFSLVGMQPIRWTVTHTLALARMMAWELNIAWKNELTFAYLGEHLDRDSFAELMPQNKYLSQLLESYSGDSYTASALLPILQIDQKWRHLMQFESFGAGSNAWAVGPGKTQSSYPLLAGDPHLGLSMPGKWYEVHLSWNGRNLSGATLAGSPAVILGQNDSLAWSFTNLMLDDTDFFVEALNPENPREYILDSLAGEPVMDRLQLQRQLIRIRNRPDSVFIRRLTKHGPVVSDIYPDEKLVSDRVVAMRWTGHEVSNEFEALLGMNWAGNMQEFQRHLPSFRVPGQNVIYADKNGNIARFSMARIPLRSGSPVGFRQGWNPDADWQGYVPFDDLPKEVNPPRGWVANANHAISDEEYPYYITIYWEPDSRYNRIRQYLTDRELHSTETFQVMQNDSYSNYAAEMTNQILPVLKRQDDPVFSTVISYLENWEYRYEPSETAATILDVFTLKYSANTFEDEMGEEVYRNFIRFSGLPARILLRLTKNGSAFFDRVDTPETETREEIIVQSMQETIQYLEEEIGSEPFEWRWENLHTLTLKPPLFGEAADEPDAGTALKLIVNNLLSKGPYPARGHGMSVNNGLYRWSDPYAMVLGPSIRRIVDFSDLGKTLSIIPTGQSGNPISEYFGDQTEDWLEGRYKLLYQDSTLFRESTVRTTLLRSDR